MTRALARVLALTLLLVLAAGTVLPAAAAAPGEAKVIEIEVSRYGWNGDPDAIFTVEEGELVELHFTYGDGDMAEDNPHAMLIEGMDLQSGDIGRDMLTTVLRFRPEQTGTYTLKCVVKCEGHEALSNGRLRVVAAGASGSGIQPETTRIKMATTPPAAPGGEAEVRALVTTAAGTPLEGVAVEFTARTTFVMSGWMAIGEARTNADGEAVLRFRPTVGGDQTVRARYAGSGRYLGAEATFNLAAPTMDPTYQREGGGTVVPGLGFWLLWLLVGAIWLTYLFIFYQLRQVAVNR